jgi:predicted DNA-binding transcriptional regulator AlpA
VETPIPTPPLPDVEPLVPLRRVAEIVGRNPRTVMSWVGRGEFPAPVRLPGSKKPCWTAAAVREWLAARTGGQ